MRDLASRLSRQAQLNYMYYNFARPHQSLKGKMPVMAAGIADHVWAVEEIVTLCGE